MAVKPIVDIEVNDSEFKDFAALFDKYQKQLERTPAAWAAVNKEGRAAQTAFNSIAAALLAQTELSRKKAQTEREAANAAREQETSWERISRSTRAASGHIIDATKSLLKWTGVVGAVSGLLGAGGIFGIDRLAGSVSATRRTATGLGISYGQQQAFGLNFGRFVDPNSVLSNVAGGLYDVTSPQYRAMLSMGVSPSTLNKGNAADAAVAAMQQLPRLFGNVSQAQLGPLMHAYGADQIFSQEDVLRYLHATPGERADQIGHYGKDVSALGQGEGAQRQWQDFLTQLDRAGDTIKNTFVTGLTPILPSLTDFSIGLTKTLSAFLDSPTFAQWMVEANAALERFSKYIQTDEFLNGVKSVADDMKTLGTAVLDLASIIGQIINPHQTDFAKRNQDEAQSNEPEFMQRFDNWLGGLFGQKPKTVYGPGHSSAFVPTSYEPNVSPELLASVANVESHGNPNAVGPMTRFGRALGMFQMLPSTAQRYGVTNPLDPADEGRGASRYLGDLLKEFRGDTAKAAAGYNWGEGNVERDIKRYGDAWRDHLPAETRDYVDKVLRGVGHPNMQAHRSQPRGKMLVDVRNNTGGSAIIVASQLAV